MRLSTRLPWEKANPLWASALNPLLANGFTQGNLLENLQLAVGTNTFNHGLARAPRGWVVVDQTVPTQLSRSQPFNTVTLTITATAAASVSLYVF